MRAIIISLIAITCIGVHGADNKETKSPDRQIAILESKNFALENENKKLKAELEKKDKVINALAMKIAGQSAKGNSRNSVNNSSRGYDPAEAQRKAVALQKEQQRQQRARQLAIISRKIKYYEKQKSELEKEYAAAAKKVQDAKYTIGKSRREDATIEAKEEQSRIKSKMSSIDYSIESLKRDRLNYL